MKKHNGGAMLGGALIGAALGVAAGLLLAPESGKKMRTDIKKLSGEFYRYLTPKLKKMKHVGEAEYDALVAEGMKSYAKAKKLSGEEVKVLTAQAKRSWKEIKKHLG